MKKVSKTTEKLAAKFGLFAFACKPEKVNGDLVQYLEIGADRYDGEILAIYRDSKTQEGWFFESSVMPQRIKEELPRWIESEKHLREVIKFLNSENAQHCLD